MTNWQARFAAAALGLLGPLALLAQPAAAADTHCLWAVSGASNTVYLLGSIHLMKPEQYPLPDAFEAAYADSAVVVTEIDLAVAQAPDAQLALLARGHLPEGQDLRRLLAPATCAAVSNHLASRKLDMARFASFKPWLLAMTITMLDVQARGFSPAHGLDAHLDARARRDKKPLLALETLDDQLAAFDAFSNADADNLLRLALDEITTLEQDLARLVAAWSAGDSEALASILLESFEDYPHLKAKLLTERNDAWLRQLSAMLRDERNYLVVVGAGHLVGADGLVARLRAAGHRVEQR